MGTTATKLVEDAKQQVLGISHDQLEVHLYAQTAQVIDVREPEERTEAGWIAGSVHIPRGLLEFRADPENPGFVASLDPTRTTVVYCGAGGRSALAARTLTELGWSDVARLEGGLQTWQQAGRPVVGLAPWQV